MARKARNKAKNGSLAASAAASDSAGTLRRSARHASRSRSDDAKESNNSESAIKCTELVVDGGAGARRKAENQSKTTSEGVQKTPSTKGSKSVSKGRKPMTTRSLMRGQKARNEKEENSLAKSEACVSNEIVAPPNQSGEKLRSNTIATPAAPKSRDLTRCHDNKKGGRSPKQKPFSFFTGKGTPFPSRRQRGDSKSPEESDSMRSSSSSPSPVADPSGALDPIDDESIERSSVSPRKLFRFDISSIGNRHRGNSPESEESSKSNSPSPLANHDSDQAGRDSTTIGPEIVDLTSRFATLGVSVDGGEQENPPTDPVVIDLTENRVERILECPPGKLGILLSQVDQTWTKVLHVQPGSVMYRRCLEGDYIKFVGNWNARYKSPIEIAAEFQRTQHLNRIVRVLRVVPLADDTHGERNGSRSEVEEASVVGNGRSSGGTSEAPSNSDTTTLATNSGTTAQEEEEVMYEERQGSVLATRFTRRGATVINEKAKQAEEKKQSGKHVEQKVGSNASRISDFHGKSATKQLRLSYQRMFVHATMVTPRDVIDGVRTASWPKIQPFHILIDPFVPSNCNGGQREKQIGSIIRKKKLVLFVGKDQRCLDNLKAILTDLVKSGWSSEEYEVETAFDVESAMLAYGGNRKRAAPTASEPTREVSGANTPDVRQRRHQRRHQRRSQRRAES